MEPPGPRPRPATTDDPPGPRLRVGPLHTTHRARLQEILEATGAFRDDEVAVAVELFDEAQREPNADYVFLGAFTPEDDLIAYACYGPTPGTDRTWDLYWIAVDPAAHGRGVGTTLLDEVERRLTGQHARMLVIETSSRSEYAPTRAFYGRRGYRECACVRGFYAPGDDRIMFAKRFPSSPTGRGVQAP